MDVHNLIIFNQHLCQQIHIIMITIHSAELLIMAILMLMIIITLICVAASKYRDSKTFSFHWRRLLSFYIIYYYYLSWKILKLLLLQHRMNKWMKEWIMKNAFLSDFSLNIKLFYVERWMSTIYYFSSSFFHFLFPSCSFPWISTNFHLSIY